MLEIQNPFNSLNDLLLSFLIMSNYSFLNSCQMVDLFKKLTNEKYSSEDLFEIEIYFIKRKEEMKDNFFFNNIDRFFEKIDHILKKNGFRLEFKTNILSCVFCTASLNRKIFKKYECVTYFLFKPTSLCYQIAFLCSNTYCQAKHFLSFAVLDSKLKYYNDSTEKKFISFSCSTIFELKILKTLSFDLIYKHSSFNSFSLAFNSILKNNFFCYGFEREYLEEERLTEAFFYYRYLLLIKENNKFKPLFFPRICELEDCFNTFLNELPTYFTNKWSKHTCKEKKCCNAIAIDGNHKIHRRVCCFDELDLIIPEATPIQIGCVNTPLLGSFYCERHSKDFIYLQFYEQRLRFTKDQIICKKGQVNIQRLLIHDSIQVEGKFFFLASYEDKIPFFVTSKQVQSIKRFFEYEVYSRMINSKILEYKSKINDEKEETNLSECNSSKFACFPCKKKNKTVGTFISSFNCGIICGKSKK